MPSLQDQINHQRQRITELAAQADTLAAERDHAYGRVNELSETLNSKRVALLADGINPDEDSKLGKLEDERFKAVEAEVDATRKLEEISAAKSLCQSRLSALQAEHRAELSAHRHAKGTAILPELTEKLLRVCAEYTVTVGAANMVDVNHVSVKHVVDRALSKVLAERRFDAYMADAIDMLDIRPPTKKENAA